MKDHFIKYRRLSVFVIRSFFTLLLFNLGLHTSFAQTYPVQASLVLSPPYSIHLADYTNPGSNKLMVNLYFADLSKPTVNVKFRLKIEGVGIEIRTRESFSGKLFVLSSGIPEIMYGDQLSEYFKLDNLEFSGISKEALERTGTLPEGVYRFSLEVLEYNRGVRISNVAGTMAWLVLNDPPLLNFPSNDQEITSIDPQIIRFQWTPRHKGSPNASFNTEYLLKVVEIWPEGRNPYDAINTMSPVFEIKTLNNYYVMGLGDPLLIPGRTYAWQVQAVATSLSGSSDLFKNGGNSEVRTFRFGQVCPAPFEVNLVKAHNRSLELEWPAPENATGFTILFKHSEDDSFWYEEFTTIPYGKVSQLKQDTGYEVQVVSYCSMQESEPSQSYLFKTTNDQNEFVCSTIDFQPDLTNNQPIEYLYPGEIIKAGDFDVEIIRLSRAGHTYSGIGLVQFPFLQQLSTYVSFNDLKVNTDKAVYEGFLTTIYQQDSPFMLDQPGDGSSNLPTDPATTLGPDLPADSTNLPGSVIPVDSIYINEGGEIIVVLDGMANPVSADELRPGEEFRDNEGNTVSLGNDGALSYSPSSTPAGNVGPANQIVASNNFEFSFGPLHIALNEEKDPEVKGEFCEFDKVEVDLTLELEDFDMQIKQVIELESAYFSYTKKCENGEFVAGKLHWDNSQGSTGITLVGILGVPELLEIELDASGIKSGKLILMAGLTRDLDIGGIAILREGIDGQIKFKLSRVNEQLTSAFDFSGVENINLDLVKQNQVIAQIQNASFSESGSLVGRFTLAQEVSYSIDGFEANLKKLNLDISYRLGQKLKIEKGDFKILLRNLNLLQGEIVIDGKCENDLVEAELSGKNLSAFGMELSDLNLKVDLDTRFNLSTIHGNLEGQHPELGSSLNINQFRLSNGKLKQFDFSGDLNHDGVKIIIEQAILNSTDGYLELSAFAELEYNDIHVAAELQEFLVYPDGTVQWGEYDINFDGVKTFGPLKVAISGASGEGSGTWRHTLAKASMQLDLEGIPEPIAITGATIEFEKHKNKDRYRNIVIGLEDANIRFKTGLIDTKLATVDLKLESTENYIIGDGSNASTVKITEESYVKFNLSLAEDIEIGQLMYLNQGLSGFLRYSFSGKGVKGTLSYEEIENLNIEIRKNDQVLARLSDTNLSSDGLLTGKLTALEGANFRANGFVLTVNNMAYDIRFSLGAGLSALEVLSGSGSLMLEGAKALSGSLQINYKLDEFGNILAAVDNNSTLNAFGMELIDFVLAAELTNEFELKKIEGTLEARHDDLGGELLVSSFLLEEGELRQFNLQGSVLYNGFDFKLLEASYESQLLKITGEVAIDVAGTAAWLAIEELTIEPDGMITVRGIAGELDKAPVLVSFSADMAESRFKGTFNGELAGIGLSGGIDLGVSENNFQFAYLELAAKGNIPLAGTGLKLTELGGQLGYNYKLVYNADGNPEGNPQENNYVVGLLVGVSDLANMVQVNGNTVAQFGNEQLDLLLAGDLKIPKEQEMITGEVTVNYQLPQNTLDGRMSLGLRVPSTSGRILSTNLDMDYAYSAAEWSLSSTDISAILFEEVGFTGNIDIMGSDRSKVKGKLDGRVDYAFNYAREFTALSTTFRAAIEAGISFNGQLAFDHTGMDGKVYLLVYANGELGVVSDIGEYSSLLAISGTSEASMTFHDDQAQLAGNLEILISVLGFEHNVVLEIDKQI